MAQKKTMKMLKKVLITVSALISLQYGKKAGKIIFASDISLNGWSTHLD